MKRKVIVVDLDGTLYKINTFHYFIKFLLFYAIKNFNLILLLKIVLSLTSRLLKLSSHSQMKFAILSATVAIEPIDYNLFVDNIKSKKRNIEVLQNSDYDIRILATAAPSCYADIIAKRDMFDVSLATAFPESGYYENFENKGEVKKESVLHYLKSIGYSEIDMHVTDHIDDLPLMKIAKRNLLVSPSNLLKSQLAEQQINFEIIQ